MEKHRLLKKEEKRIQLKSKASHVGETNITGNTPGGGDLIIFGHLCYQLHFSQKITHLPPTYA